jgi:hypothetical protein
MPAWFDANEPSWTGTTWGAGVDFCIAQGKELCPYEVICPEGGGSPPVGGTKSGDKWSPMSDGANRWVQVGVWNGDATNTCLGHHEIAGGVHGDPAWGLDSNRHGFMTWVSPHRQSNDARGKKRPHSSGSHHTAATLCSSPPGYGAVALLLCSARDAND